MVTDLGERKQRTEQEDFSKQEEAQREMTRIALGLVYYGLCLGKISDEAMMMMTIQGFKSSNILSKSSRVIQASRSSFKCRVEKCSMA